MDKLEVASVNCGKCCGSTEGQCSIIDAVAEVLPKWGLIFLSEVDGFRQNHIPNFVSPYTSFRHWPGEGSFAMKFVIRHPIRKFVRKVTWRGRCGAVHLWRRDSINNIHLNVFVIGVHISHGDAQIDALNDLAHLLKHRPWASKVLIVGDWNIDQLPTTALDPYSHLPWRDLHHAVERLRLDALAERFHLDVNIPSRVCSAPGGPFNTDCWYAPISRIPVGDSCANSYPSLLDYALSSPGLVQDSTLHWHGMPADHAMNAVVINSKMAFHRPGKTNWKCRDEHGCMLWIRNHAPQHFDDLFDFHAFLIRLQTAWADEQTCRDRRHERIPPKIRDLYDKISNCTLEADRRRLQKVAWNLGMQWFSDHRSRILCEKVRKGGVFNKSKKLHKIESIVLSDLHAGRSGEHSHDEQEWCAELGNQFRNKWGHTSCKTG